MQEIIMFAVLASTYLMVISKRIPALIRAFRYQSLCLCALTAVMAWSEGHADLYVIAALVLAVKVFVIPHFLYRVIKKIKTGDDLGMLVNAQLSLTWALCFTYLAWVFTVKYIASSSALQVSVPAVSLFMVLAGLFLMVCRMTALAQIVGLLAMENGLFLLAAAVSGGMPFFVELALFFDVFVSVLIMGLFVYRINKLFTHIDVNKLSRLRG